MTFLYTIFSGVAQGGVGPTVSAPSSLITDNASGDQYRDTVFLYTPPASNITTYEDNTDDRLDDTCYYTY